LPVEEFANQILLGANIMVGLYESFGRDLLSRLPKNFMVFAFHLRF